MLVWLFVAGCVQCVQCAYLLGTVDGQPCTKSKQCADDQCCRDTNSNATLVNNPSELVLVGVSNPSGQCMLGRAGPGENCDSHCSCTSGYSCYFQITGVCCGLPGVCLKEREARRRRLMDMCFPPPMAPNPGAGGPGALEARRRRSSFSFYPLPCSLLRLRSRKP